MTTMKRILFLLIFLPSIAFSQKWKDSNVGLYPESFQWTYNVRNTGFGFMYGHLFKKPFFKMPVGLYGSISSTIDPSAKYNNYTWEGKLSFGGSLTLPKALKQPFHTMFLCGLIYNLHQDLHDIYVISPGLYVPGIYHTTPLSCDIGIRIYKEHFTASLLIDTMNFFRYAQLSIGFNFFNYK
jgi:hypothetical protein